MYQNIFGHFVKIILFKAFESSLVSKSSDDKNSNIGLTISNIHLQHQSFSQN